MRGIQKMHPESKGLRPKFSECKGTKLTVLLLHNERGNRPDVVVAVAPAEVQLDLLIVAVEPDVRHVPPRTAVGNVHLVARSKDERDVYPVHLSHPVGVKSCGGQDAGVRRVLGVPDVLGPVVPVGRPG